jgi:hexulose-6-phosphate isomerase
MKRSELRLGIYEKALPYGMSWRQRLGMAKRLGFDFVEMSIDETDERLARLHWTNAQRLELVRDVCESGIPVPSICLSAHRRFPLGSKDSAVRTEALRIMEDAIRLAVDIGVRVIQVAGYDEYYGMSDGQTDAWFLETYARCERMAKRHQVMLSFEIMDTPYLSSVSRFMELKKRFPSCWTSVYPDVGNLSAWGGDLERELRLGRDWITAVHLKDTIAVTADAPGVFKEVAFGSGCVDFTKVFSVLRDIDYCGPFLIEMWSGKVPDPEPVVQSARQFMIDHMLRAGYLER